MGKIGGKQEKTEEGLSRQRKCGREIKNEEEKKDKIIRKSGRGIK